jgi:hypothetical protein
MIRERVSLSVIVVPLVRGDLLTHLLRFLLDRANLPADAEILVVDVAPAEVEDPRVQLLTSPPGTSVPQRRALGASRANGAVVAFVEDTVIPDAGWGHAILVLHRRHPEAASIGGTTRIGPGVSPRGIALLLLDYGRFLLPGALSEAVSALPGNNLSFKCAALEVAGVIAGGSLREAELLSRLGKRGAVRLESAMAVTCVAADPLGLRAASRFQHGRLYAGLRLPPGRKLERYGRALLAPLLPMVLASRGLRAFWRLQVPRPARVLRHVAWMSAAWSLGEAAGYLLGPGDAESLWK